MEITHNPGQPLDRAWYLFIRFMQAVTTKDSAALLSYGPIALKAHSDLDMVVTVREIRRTLVLSCYEQGLVREADHYRIVGESDCVSPLDCHHVDVIEAYSAVLAGDSVRARDRLRMLFDSPISLACFGCFFFWYPEAVISRLCAEALQAGTEVERVHEVVRRRRLVPEDIAFGAWPWPVRIYTLGRFRVEVEGVSVAEERIQRRPRALLETLIASGGVEIKVDRIAELLWPDAEGDAGLSAFTTTVSRLRKLLGEKAVVVKTGRISLDRRYCWWDVRALESELQKSGESWLAVGAIQAWTERLLGLYRGPFLVDESEEWARAARYRLQKGVARALGRCVAILREAGQAEEAAGLMERLARADPAMACGEWVTQ